MSARFAAAVLLTTSLGLTQWGADAQTPTDVQAPSGESQDPRYGGGDGLSDKTAVVIRATGDVAGIRAEYAWIAKQYPGSKRLRQALTAKDQAGKSYDVITIQTNVGTKVTLWFDISAMFK